MNKSLTCSQVLALINSYVTGNINSKLREDVEKHISKCHSCRKRVEDLTRILLKFDNINEEVVKEEQLSLNPKLMSNLSAYIDNELPAEENIKIKKITISNQTARKHLEKMYQFHKLMQSAYAKTKSNLKTDYSKGVISYLQKSENYTTVYFYRLIILFSVLIVAIVVGFIYLYF